MPEMDTVRSEAPAASTVALSVPAALFRRLRELAARHERSIDEIVRDAIELHYDDGAVSARSRLVDRLARLEAGLGDSAHLQEEVAHETRKLRHEVQSTVLTNSGQSDRRNKATTG